MNLVCLGEMLSPVGKHDEHKHIQRALMPNGIQLIVEIKVVGGSNARGFCGSG